MNPIPQMEPWFDVEEQEAVSEYMRSGGWITEFRKTQEFESSLAQFVGAKESVATVNGTVALALALMATGISRDDEVIVPDLTMIASANSVVLAGGTPVLVDIDEETMCVDLEQAAAAVTPRTSALVYVPMNGRSGDMNAVRKFCDDEGILLIEDSAQALGCYFRGRHLGTFGAVGTFSFSTPKIISTGQGGALVSDDDDLMARARKIKDFGRAEAGIDRHDVLGYNFKFTDIQAVIGLEQMKKLAWRIDRKRTLFSSLRGAFEPGAHVRVPETDLSEVTPWFFDIRVDALVRQPLMDHLKNVGIGTRPMYYPLHTQSPYVDTQTYKKSEFPNATKLSSEVLWLPSSSRLTDSDMERVCTAITQFFGS